MSQQTVLSPQTFGQISIALLIGSLALLVLGLQPILLGGLADAHRITLAGLGLVAMGEIVAIGIGVAVSDAILPASAHRLVAIVAALVVAGIDVGTLAVAGDGTILVLRAAAGLLEGALIWVATTTIIRTREPDRVAAIFVVLQTVAQADVAGLIARIVVPEMGWRGAFALLAALLGIGALFAVGLNPKLAPIEKEEDGAIVWQLSHFLVLAIAFLQMAALGAFWTYLEPLALSAGFGQQDIQTLTSGILLIQVCGGIAATLLIRRLNVAVTLSVGGVILGLVTGAIYFLPQGATVGFTVLCAVFGLAWLFLNPFQFGSAFRADGTGRLALVVPAAQLLGLAFGPLISSFVVGDNNVRAVTLLSFALATASALVTWIGRGLWVKAQPMPAESYVGKVVLIAGASSGIGRVLALRFAEEGANLIVTARRREKLESLAEEARKFGVQCLALPADAESAEATAEVIARAVEKFGRIDLAVLNVGGAPALDMREMSAGDVTAYMRSNYDTIVNYLFPTIAQMAAQKGGVIAHTNSLAGFLGLPLQGPYSAAKGALRLLIDACRIEFTKDGIEFLSIYPGFIATEATAADGMPAPMELSEDQAVEHMLTAIRHRRWDYAFPLQTSLLVKLAGILPKPVTKAILTKDYHAQHARFVAMKAAGLIKRG